LRGFRRFSKLRDGVAEVEWAVYVGCDHRAWVAPLPGPTPASHSR